jgi:hypothetical protein
MKELTDDIIISECEALLAGKWRLLKIFLQPDGSAFSELFPEGRWRAKEVRRVSIFESAQLNCDFMLYLEADPTARDVQGVRFDKEEVAYWMSLGSEPWVLDLEE